jgi:N-carbamoylputrescine amidase
MKNTRIAVVMCRAPLNRVDENLARMSRWVAAAEAQQVDIVCFPELNISGYSTRESLQPSAEPIPGPITDRVAAMAAAHRVTILAGMVETGRAQKVFVSHLVVSPDGLQGVYRKLHVAPPELPVFDAGDTVPLFQSGGITFGIQLCYDAHFPELTTRMAMKGAEAVFFPHASPRNSARQKAASWMRHLPARAFDNGIYVVACNQVGDNEAGLNFPGVAVAIDPSGNLLQERLAESAEMMVLDLDGAALQAVRSHPMRYFLPHRRPELYRS